MKVFVAGATGAIGRQLVPRLTGAGHEVWAMARSSESEAEVQRLGASAVRADALVAEQVADAVARAEPEVIVHELTAIPGALDIRHFDRDFALTNRLRTEGTDHLLSAGRAAAVRRFVAQSYAGWPTVRTDRKITNEDDPLDPNPVASMRETHDAIRYLENAVVSADWTEGIVLRYGALYGPGTSLGAEGEQTEMIRRRKYPLVGDGGGVWSFIHVADAAAATVAAVEHGAPGIYNIVDDEPAAVAEWLPAAAAALGARPPQHIPRWVGRLVAGEAATLMMTEIRGAANDKAKRSLGWQPEVATWREGFTRELAGTAAGTNGHGAA
jgi:nucleoside-diphosphate-sugar epimerase